MAETDAQQGVDAIPDQDLISELQRRVKARRIRTADLGFSKVCSECSDWIDDDAVTFNSRDSDDLAAARSYMVQRNYREALWSIEKALGDGFTGLSELRAEDLK